MRIISQVVVMDESPIEINQNRLRNFNHKKFKEIILKTRTGIGENLK